MSKKTPAQVHEEAVRRLEEALRRAFEEASLCDEKPLTWRRYVRRLAEALKRNLSA